MRKFSQKYIDRKISQIDELYEKCQNDFPLLPESQRILPFELKQINDVIKHRSKLSYVNGFWLGYSLALGTPQEENKK